MSKNVDLGNPKTNSNDFIGDVSGSKLEFKTQSKQIITIHNEYKDLSKPDRVEILSVLLKWVSDELKK